MSNDLTSDMALSEMGLLLGGPSLPNSVEVDPDEQAVFEAVYGARRSLVRVMEHDGVGVNALSRRLGVSPSAASKMVSSESDMKISTVVLWARALGRQVTISVAPSFTVLAFGPTDTTASTHRVYELSHGQRRLTEKQVFETTVVDYNEHKDSKPAMSIKAFAGALE